MENSGKIKKRTKKNKLPGKRGELYLFKKEIISEILVLIISIIKL